MTALPNPTPTSVRWFGRLLLISGLGVLALTALFAQLPISEVFPPREVALDTASVQSDGGMAYRMALGSDPPLPSDRGAGRSALLLTEDGTPLKPHGLHQQLRDGVTGSFSHWGERVYLTATDGSDPGQNGRSYQAWIPRDVPPWVLQALGLGLSVGLALTLIALLWPGTRLWRLSSVLPLLVVVLLASQLVPRSSWWSALAAVDQAHSEALGLPSQSVFTDPVGNRPGNVTRLLPGGGPVSFTARGTLPSQLDARRVPFVAEDGVAEDAGFVRLVPGGPGLVAVLDPPMPVAEIAMIQVPAQLVEGGQLELRLMGLVETGRSRVLVPLPALPRDELQTLVVQRPFEFFTVKGEVNIGSVELALPFTAETSARLRADEVVLAGASARFRRAPEGEDALSCGDELRPTHWQSLPGRLAVPLTGEGRLLKGAVGLFGRSPRTPVRYRGLQVDSSGAESLLFEGELTDVDGWSELRAELPSEPLTDGDTLVLAVDSLPPGTALGWSNWRLVDSSRPPRRVLMVLADTLRVDALSAFGGTAAHTPVLDALAEDGVRFERCYAQAHWTRPSMPSIMTARYAPATGVETVGQQLPESYMTLAESFAEAGFMTIGDVANTHAGPSSGLGQGWDQLSLYRDPVQGSAREQLSGSLPGRLAQAAEEDLLVYVHLMDAHGPYGPHEAPSDLGPQGADILPRREKLDRPWLEHPTAEGRRYWYYRDIEALDAALGSFLDTLDVLWGPGARRELTYAVLADHGEYLGEDAQWGHGWHQLLPPVVHVPLLLGGPALSPGQVVTTPVENIDVAPTLLELAGIAAAALSGADGRSLLPLLADGDTSQHNVAVASVKFGTKEQLSIFGESVALLGDRGRLVGQLELAALGAPLGREPGLSADQESLADHTLGRELATQFAAFWQAHAAAAAASRAQYWDAAAGQSLSVDPVSLRQLQQLGYVERPVRNTSESPGVDGDGAR